MLRSKVAIAAACFALAGCAGDPRSVETGPAVELARTQYGVAHVKARDYVGLGYGFAYAHATDNFCLLAEHLVSAAGERSKYFGAEGAAAKNVAADFFARYYYGGAEVQERFRKLSAPARDLIRGYVAGYNRYLSERGPDGVAAACRGAAWIRPMTIADMHRIFEAKSVLTSGNGLSDAMLAARPPNRSASLQGLDPSLPTAQSMQYGSNGWAFGRDVTENRSGLLIGNPHFPWAGDNRFYQVHLTIPGELDVMGATIAPLPMVSIGFNKDVAWTHTVSYARRQTFFELALDPQNPERYLLDGQSQPMKRVPVSIEVKKPDGSLETQTHVFYESVHGPIVVLPKQGANWTAARAYALGDGNRGNTDQLETWIAYGKARSVGEIRDAASRTLGMPWVNTLAADRHGDALYADISRVPNVTAETLARCAPSAPAAALAKSRVFVLDGSKASCNWTAEPKLAGRGLLPAAALPSVVRGDYVANANDNYWLVNADIRLQAGSPLVGNGADAQGLRTRMQLTDIRRRLAGQDGLPGRKFSAASAQAVLFSNRNYAGLVFGDDVVRLCGRQKSVTVGERKVELAPLCKLLSAWDRTDSADSRGAILFREFWYRAEPFVEDKPEAYRVPFDPADPVDTPAKLDIDNPVLAGKLLTALGEAALFLADNGWRPDSRPADAQAVTRNGARIYVPGGYSSAGVLNAMRLAPLGKGGYVPVHGTSYVQLVTFDADGPVADGVLAYAQSVDPASPYFADQTALFAKQKLYRLPYRESEIRSDPGYLPVSLPDDPVLHGRR